MKHGAHAIVADRSISELTRDVEFFDADAVIATGQRTGDSVDLQELEEIGRATRLAVLVGSGVTLSNVGAILERAAGVIIGSSLKMDGTWWSAVDRQKVARSCRTLPCFATGSSPRQQNGERQCWRRCQNSTLARRSGAGFGMTDTLSSKTRFRPICWRCCARNAPISSGGRTRKWTAWASTSSALRTATSDIMRPFRCATAQFSGAYLFSDVMKSICEALLGPDAYLFFDGFVVKGAEADDVSSPGTRIPATSTPSMATVTTSPISPSGARWTM